MDGVVYMIPSVFRATVVKPIYIYIYINKTLIKSEFFYKINKASYLPSPIFIMPSNAYLKSVKLSRI